jgi:hypothetical protein
MSVREMLTAIEKSAANLFVIIAEIEVIWQAVFKSTRSLEAVGAFCFK